MHRRRDPVPNSQRATAMKTGKKRVFVGALIAMCALWWGHPSHGQITHQHDTPGTQEHAATTPTDHLLPSPHDKSGHEGQFGVTIHEGKLSVASKEDDFRAVMEEIGRLTGIQIRFFGEDDDTPLTVSFESLPMNDGLARLLRNRNYVFVYSHLKPERHIGKILLLPSSTSKPLNLDPSTIATFFEGLQESITPELMTEAINEVLANLENENAGRPATPEPSTEQLKAFFQNLPAIQGEEPAQRNQYQDLIDQLQLQADQ